MAFLDEAGTKALYQLLVKKIGDGGGMSSEQASHLNTLWEEKVKSTAVLTFTGDSNYIKGDTAPVSLSWDYKELGQSVTPDTLTLKTGSTTLVSNPSTKTYTNPNGVTSNTSYVLSVKHGNLEKSATVSINFYSPVLFGFTNTASVDSLAPSSLSGVSSTAGKTQGKVTSVAGTYTGTPVSGNYFWICVPGNLTVSSIKSGGFSVPFTDMGTKTDVTFSASQSGKAGSDTYRCYRTTSALGGNAISFVIA